MENGIKINKDKIIKRLKEYSVATATDVLLINRAGEIIYNSNNVSPCRFCDKLKQLVPDTIPCSKVFMYGSLEAQRFGGKYIFFCPLGFTHWAAPILYDGIAEFTAIGGPALMMDVDEFIHVDLALRMNLSPPEIETVREYLDDIQIVSPQRVTSLSEQLFCTAYSLCEGDNSEYFEIWENQKNHNRISEYVHYIKSISTDYEVQSYPLEKEKELTKYISDGNKEAAQELLNEILGYILFKSGKDFETIKSRVLELVVVLSRAAIEGGGDTELIFGLNYRYINEIHTINTTENLIDWLNNIMKRFSETVFSYSEIKHIDALYKAMKYIKTEYMNKLTLEDVAKYVNFSPSYFSKIFKEETGSTFNNYLNKIRIDNSKGLLLDASINMIDVAQLVGYEDQSYYSKVFKKLTGMTPGKYRETGGRTK